MIIPVRCFSCGKPVADKFDEYSKKIGEGQTPAKALDEVGMTRYCCRRMFLGQVDLLEEILPYARF
ncbi:TPA: DNA-directed RNA polymerase subunit N [Candidatus Micrarchaeota archaeon]|nr:MAG: DNA-directed RNA polymerase subunit N [Candidatus Micrarchaeota archaeon CG1_02_51_15]HII38990.1 DNA-directed RNA polymerase subunit N [Candidatus Micrarchaeota archaeon]